MWCHPDDPQTHLRDAYLNIDQVLDRVTYSGPNVLQSAMGDVEGHQLLAHLMYEDPSELMVLEIEQDGTVHADKHESPYNLKLPLALQATATVGDSCWGDEDAGMTHAWLRFDHGLAKRGTEEKRCFARNLFLNLFGFKALTTHGVGDGPHGSGRQRWEKAGRIWQVRSQMPVLPALSPPPGISLPLKSTRDVPGKPTKKRRTQEAAKKKTTSAMTPQERTTQTQAPAVSKGAALPASSSMEQPLAQSLPQAAEEPQQEHGLPLAPLPRADAPSTSDVPEESPASSSLEQTLAQSLPHAAEEPQHHVDDVCPHVSA